MQNEEGHALNESDFFGNVTSDLWNDLRQIAYWKKTYGKGKEGPFLILADSNMPMNIRQTVNRLNAFTYNNLPLDEIGFSIEGFDSLENYDMDIPFEDIDFNEEEELINPDSFLLALSQVICSFNDREFKIFNDRYLIEEPRSYEDIGKEFGVTRERIRQIEKGFHDRVQSVFDEFSIEEKLSALFTNKREFMRVSKLNNVFPEFEELIPSSLTPVKWVIRNYCRFTFEEKDGWIASPSILDAKRLFRDRLRRQTSRHGILRKDVLSSFVMYDEELEDIIDWARYCGLSFYKDYLILYNTIGEYAEAVLEIENQPMSTEELQAIVDPNTDVRPFRQKLYQSQAIMRTDVRMWGLRDWEIDEYKGIEQAIIEVLNAQGGSVQYNELIRELRNKYSVSVSSIRSKISTGAFSIQEGIVSLSKGLINNVDSSINPYFSAKLFRLEKRWAYRFTVTERLKRGSGLYVTKAIANILYMKPNDVVYLPSPINFQRIAWTSGVVTVGTISRFILEGLVKVGQEAFLIFNDDGSFDIAPMRVTNDSGIHKAMALACLPPVDNIDSARRSLALAVGLPSTATFRELVQRYKERGDTNIVQQISVYSEL